MHSPSLESDLAAIEELHRRDQAAAKAWDVDALASLWSDDIVGMPPDGPMFRGREQALSGLREAAEAAKGLITTEYEQQFEEVEVLGDFAYDWGTFRGAMQAVEGGREMRYSGKLMRILKRGDDGEWRVHRTIWTIDPPV
jgi:uncharacterized protein (TIGR02246 family)